MTTRPRPRNRVLAIRRAPDGSAFQKCGTCGVSVAIALLDMHDCEFKMDNRNSKRFKGMTGLPTLPKTATQHYSDQPASPYRLFMESFMKGHEAENFLEMDRMGFEKWKNMPEEEKYPYVHHAKLLDDLHQEALNREANEIIKVDDEADSAMVGNVDKVDDEADSAMVGKVDKYHWIPEISPESESSATSSTASSSTASSSS